MPNSLSQKQQQSLERLTQEFHKCFPKSLEGSQTIGREAEYPVVHPNGQAADVRKLLTKVHEQNPEITPKFESPDLIIGLDSKNAEYSLEVGWGTIEVIVGPCKDLHQLESYHQDAMQKLFKAADELGFYILGYGVQPFTPGSLELMSPKSRYGVMYEVLQEAWLWFTTTASDQIHIDADSDWLKQMNYGTLISPFIIALCANSPIHSGQDTPFCSSREGQMGKIQASHERHGMYKNPYTNHQDFLLRIAKQPYLLHKDLEGQYYPNHGTFLDWIEQHGGSFDDFLFHEHYIWNSARARSAHATVELRCACQQPWDENMSAAALGLGLMEAAPQIQQLLQKNFQDQAWKTLYQYHKQVILTGLATPEPAENLLSDVLFLAESALKRRNKNEEAFLAPLFARLKSKQNPAQKAKSLFKTKSKEEFIKYLACN